MTRNITPEVGMPATFGIGSDRYAMIVTAVKLKGRLVVATRPEGGMSREFTLRPNGRYVSKGQTSGSLSLGVAKDYLDPSF